MTACGVQGYGHLFSPCQFVHRQQDGGLTVVLTQKLTVHIYTVTLSSLVSISATATEMLLFWVAGWL